MIPIFVVKEIVAGLFRGEYYSNYSWCYQDLTYPAYRAFDGIRDMINLVAVDSRFDFGIEDEIISSHSYMSKIITDKPNNLFNFSQYWLSKLFQRTRRNRFNGTFIF